MFAHDKHAATMLRVLGGCQDEVAKVYIFSLLLCGYYNVTKTLLNVSQGVSRVFWVVVRCIVEQSKIISLII